MTLFWVLVLIAAPVWIFWLVISCIAVLALYEFFKMTLPGISVGGLCVPVAAAALPVLVSLFNDPDRFIASLFFCLLASVIYALKTYQRLDNPLQFLALNGLATLYIGFCLAHLVFIRYLPQGVSWLLVLTAATAVSDTGAYYFGKAYGRRKLCPHISPGKTVEGAAGGVILGTLAAFGTGLVLLPEFNPLFIAVSALTLSLFSIIGDLVESIAKRSTGVKDSGSLLFGHGGVLDRMDSMLIAAPLLYFLINLEVLI
jgi:phosphatidate cytidylyltransferase